MISSETDGSVADWLQPLHLLASKAVYDKHRFRAGSVALRRPILSKGYSLIRASEPELPFLEPTLTALIRYGKTVLLECLGCGLRDWLFAFSEVFSQLDIVEVDLHSMEPQPLQAPVEFCAPPSHDGVQMFVILPGESLTRSSQPQPRKAYSRQQASSPQSVRFVGIGPARHLIPATAVRVICQSSNLIVFEPAYELIRSLPIHGSVTVLEYDRGDYQINIERLDQALGQLQVAGNSSATAIVEGNPEVYDMLPFLSSDGRVYSFDVLAPVVTLCCAWVTTRFGVDITRRGYVVVSGNCSRFAVKAPDLQSEIRAYLNVDITILVIEVSSEILPRVIQCVQSARRGKHILVFADMFKSSQQVFCMNQREMGLASWAGYPWGRFVSFAIVDDERLMESPERYMHMRNELPVNRRGSHESRVDKPAR